VVFRPLTYILYIKTENVIDRTSAERVMACNHFLLLLKEILTLSNNIKKRRSLLKSLLTAIISLIAFFGSFALITVIMF
jgi:hypothetical protein